MCTSARNFSEDFGFVSIYSSLFVASLRSVGSEDPGRILSFSGIFSTFKGRCLSLVYLILAEIEVCIKR